MAKDGPAGNLTLAAVRKRLAAGWPPGLTVLAGSDVFHLDVAQRELIAALVPREAGEFALTVYDGAKVDVRTVIAAARSAGMFAPSRVVLVRDVDVLEGDAEPVIEFAARPPARAYLIVRALQLDRRRKLDQALVRAGLCFEFGASDSMPGELRALADELGLQLDADALKLLGQICGSDLYRGQTELAKLRAWRGSDRTPVSVDDLRKIVAGSAELKGWAVASAVAERRLPAALAAMRQLAAEGEEGYMVVGGLAYRARDMLRGKDALRYAPRELLGFPATLMHADRDLKSRRLPKPLIVEEALEALIGKERE